MGKFLFSESQEGYNKGIQTNEKHLLLLAIMILLKPFEKVKNYFQQSLTSFNITKDKERVIFFP